MLNKFNTISFDEIANNYFNKNVIVTPFIKRENENFICIKDIFLAHLNSNFTRTNNLIDTIKNNLLKLSSNSRRNIINNLSDIHKTELKNKVFNHFKNIITSSCEISEIIIDKPYNILEFPCISYQEVINIALDSHYNKSYRICKTRNHTFLVNSCFIAEIQILDDIIVNIDPLITIRVKKDCLNYLKSCIILNERTIRDDIFEFWISDKLFTSKFATLKKHLKTHILFSTIKTEVKHDLFNDLFKIIKPIEVKSLREQKEVSKNLINDFIEFNSIEKRIMNENIHLTS